jgi:glucose/arabinose dehydrogenase
MKHTVIVSVLSVLFLTTAVSCATAQLHISSEEHAFTVETVARGFSHPWGMAFLPDRRIVVTERGGRAFVIDNGQRQEIRNVPAVAAGGQGGLLDVIVAPNALGNMLLYFSYAAPGPGGTAGTAIGRGRLVGDRLEDWEEIFRMEPFTTGGAHFGSRLAFLPDGTLLATIGDRGTMNRAQIGTDHAGSTIRLNPDGSVPADNPFVGDAAVRDEIFTLGNRNSQGMIVHPVTGDIWQSEHGPRGGDELNLIVGGRNYGWPIISHGADYRTGQPIGQGTHAPGMEQPVVHWTPALAPSGLAYYQGAAFPQWSGNLLLGGLSSQRLLRVSLAGQEVTHQEVLLDGQIGRIRDVQISPEGFVYVLVDSRDAALHRLVPR